MALPSINVSKLKASAREYDYIRFTTPDLNGIPRGKTISGRFVDKYIENGLDMYAVLLACGPCMELPADGYPQTDAVGTSNATFMPATDKVMEIAWNKLDTERRQDFKLGEILCEPMWNDGTIQRHGPRYLARHQLQRLDDMGFKIYSAFEVECMVVNKESLKPVFSGLEPLTVLTFSEFEQMFFEFDQMWKKAGIDIELFQSEYMPGQFEFAPVPKYGIESSDMVFHFKESMKEMCKQRNLLATFMTTPFAVPVSNGCHFNLSLWDEKGNNVFYDPNNDDNLSSIARYFIGGIIKHAPAMVALCCPTINCYRRINKPFAPSKADWDIDNRSATLRIKNLSKSQTYIENRLPSGACNPYLGMAVTIAAGIDGIINKIEPPERGINEKNVDLPTTLENALQCLKQDSAMTEALGSEFVEWFEICKRSADIKNLGKHDIKIEDKAEFEAERLEYLKLI